MDKLLPEELELVTALRNSFTSRRDLYVRNRTMNTALYNHKRRWILDLAFPIVRHSKCNAIAILEGGDLTATEFQRNHPGAANHARVNRYYNDLKKYFKLCTPKKMTYEGLLLLMENSGSLTELRKKFPNEYRRARKLGLITKLRSELKIEPPPHRRKKITTEEIYCAAKKCKHATEFKTNFPSEYAASRRLGIYKKISKGFINRTKPATFSECQRAARKYETRTQWSNNNQRTYKRAAKMGWIEKCMPLCLSAPKPIMCIELIRVFESAAQAAKYFRISPPCIRLCLSKKRKTAGGYTFRYATMEEIKRWRKNEKKG